MRWLPVLVTILCSVTTAAPDDWGPIQFLVGRWMGEGNGAPGQGTGGFSFLPDLQGKVLVRKNFAEYPPTGGKPAFRHDDLMIVYREEGSPELQAIYFDNEGHVIRYSVKPLAGGGVVMESGGPPGEPRYRMTYTSPEPDLIKIKFQIAQPGKDFAAYIEATARRESSKTPQ